MSELKIKVWDTQKKSWTQPIAWMHFILNQLIHQTLGDELSFAVIRDWRRDAAAKHCVPRVRWCQMALASVVVIMAAVLGAFVWHWGKLNGSILSLTLPNDDTARFSNPVPQDVQIEDLVSAHTAWKSWRFCKTVHQTKIRLQPLL